MCIVPCLIILFSALPERIDEQQHLAHDGRHANHLHIRMLGADPSVCLSHLPVTVCCAECRHVESCPDVGVPFLGNVVSGIVLARLSGLYVKTGEAGELLSVADEVESLRLSDDASDGSDADTLGGGDAFYLCLKLLVLGKLCRYVLFILLQLLLNGVKQLLVALAHFRRHVFHVVDGFNVVQHLCLHLDQVSPQAGQLPQFTVDG